MIVSCCQRWPASTSLLRRRNPLSMTLPPPCFTVRLLWHKSLTFALANLFPVSPTACGKPQTLFMLITWKSTLLTDCPTWAAGLSNSSRGLTCLRTIITSPDLSAYGSSLCRFAVENNLLSSCTVTIAHVQLCACAHTGGGSGSVICPICVQRNTQWKWRAPLWSGEAQTGGGVVGVIKVLSPLRYSERIHQITSERRSGLFGI